MWSIQRQRSPPWPSADEIVATLWLSTAAYAGRKAQALRVSGHLAEGTVSDSASRLTAPRALVLFAHGARDPEWAQPLRRVRAAILATSPELQVELAFLEFMQPDLATCVDRLLAGGCRQVIVLPMFLAQGGHLKRDVPLLVGELQRRYPLVRFDLATAIGEAPEVVQAMASHALALLERCR